MTITDISLQATSYIVCHRGDAEWMIGETVLIAKHAFRTTGYDLADIVRFAAGQNLVVLKIERDGIIQPIL
jgi:hypothetical protein